MGWPCSRGRKNSRQLDQKLTGLSALRLPYRGGNWNNGANAGLAALNFNNARSNTNTNIGFRPALGEKSEAIRPRLYRQHTPQKGA